MQRRIALVVPAFPKLSETFIVSKFLGLLARGWDVHVVCDRSDPEEWSRLAKLPPTPTVRRRVHLSWPHRPRWKAALLWPLAFVRSLVAAPNRTLGYLQRGFGRFGFGMVRRFYLDAELVRLGPEVVHFEFGAAAPQRMYLEELLGCRVVVSFRGYDLNYIGLEEPDYYADVWKQAAAVHFLGEDLRRRARRRGCPVDKKHALIPPAVDIDFFDPEGRNLSSRSGPLRILSVGRLEWKKGYEHALVAIRELRDDGVDVEYRILGGGGYLGALTFARHQLHLEGVVAFLGPAPREVVRAEMREADIFLHAAVSEGFCNAVMEAQAMELPVVCTDADGLPENVEDGVTGLVVPRRDPKALADAIARLAMDGELRQRMGKAGRRRVASRFRPSDQIEAFDVLYRHVLARGGGKSLVEPEPSRVSV